LFSTSLLFLLAHVCFQICLYTVPDLDYALGHNCELPLDKPWTVVRLLAPDLGIFIISLITMVLCNRLVKSREEGTTAHSSTLNQEVSGTDFDDFVYGKKSHEVNVRFFLVSVFSLKTVVLFFPGITLPSAFSALYFLLFIGVCTWWACHFPISQLGFNALCVMVSFFSAGHLVCLYLYQSTFAQSIFTPSSLWARLFGLKDIIKPTNCSSFGDLILNTEHDWPVYVNPGILLLLYITVTTVLKISSHSYTEVSALYVCVSGIDGEAPEKQEEDSPLRLVGKMIMQQSYVCALIAMMVWSITYHSWLTFVLLLWACLIWMLRARRRFAMLCSPFILLYGLGLCGLQYVWAMDLEPELPQNVGYMSLRQMGLDRAYYPCLRLGAMLLFTLTFWLLLRHSVKDIFCKKKQAAPLQENAGRDDSILKLLGRVVMSLYAKYWIYVCGGMFIMVSFAGKLVAYKIIYMLLFLLCMCLYQVYYSLWRRLLKPFWWLVVAYTMLVLIAIYTFQFEDFPGYWKNFTSFTEEQLADIGLETFKLSELFTSIMIPGFFLLACILQLHYFHKPFMKITDLEHVTPLNRSVPKPEVLQSSEGGGFEEEDLHTELGDDESEDANKLFSAAHLLSVMVPSKWGLVMDRLMVLFRKFSDILTLIQAFIWRILELHILKIVAFFVVWVALLEPSVMNLVLVVLWSFAMPYARFRPMASCLSTVWVCVIIVCKMLYQLSIVNPNEYSSNCIVPLPNETSLESNEILNSTLYKEPVDPANWFGFRKDATALGYSKNHLLVLLLLVFEATVYRHQVHHYKQLQRSPPTIPAIFPQATRDKLDQGLLPCIKYLLNYSFYKFGLEICFLMTVNVIGQRMNFLVIMHGCWLVAIMVRRRRAAIAKIWSKYCLFLVIFMIYQYILCVGIPPVLCIDYPWRWKTSLTINSALIKWIYLPDFYTIPNSKNLIADFLLLMCASQQWKVFENEKKEEWMVMGGENNDNPDPMEGIPFNPAPNFINCRSYLDMAKVLVFRYMFWFVLAVVFVTGSTRISVFGLGYLLACFFFLLFGTQLLIKRSRTRLLMWDCLIIYNVAVIISKNILSILACVFVAEMQSRFCWVIQLFSLVCTVKGYYDPESLSDKDCSLPVEEAGIIWDSICFFFLLLQRRVFLSFYFLHVTADLQASARQSDVSFFCVCGSLVVLHSGDYYLFESDSEEEEDVSVEEQKQRRQTAFQVTHMHKPRLNRTGSDTVQRILDILKFLWVLCLAMVDGLTLWLNMLTKQYVDTSTVLCDERYMLTHNISQVGQNGHHLKTLASTLCCELLCVGNEAGSARVLYISGCSAAGLEEISELDGAQGCSSTTLSSQPTLQLEAESRAYRRQRRSRTASELLSDRYNLQPELVQSREFYSTQNRLLKLLFALYNVLAAHSELVCYFIIVLNNVVTASVISLVLPILTFLWAMLAVPRPSKSFWMTAIVYTEVMVVVKYLFQFGFYPWNSVRVTNMNKNDPFFIPRILGLEKTDNYIRYDLLQLLALFFHRSLLQRYGLWDQEGPLEEKASPSSEQEKAKKEGEEMDAGVFELDDKTPEPDQEAQTQTDTQTETQTDPEQSQSCTYPGVDPLVRNVYRPPYRFFQNILHAEYRAATDVYALMFLTDVVDFIIIVFGFWAFGKHSAATDIASTLSEDQVPEAFLVMLLIQFSTMVIDRALYLRKAMLGKLIFQVILVFGIHLWMFFILPAVTERMFSQNFVAQLWYFVKCIYFTLSAYQIRCGYPTRILGNFLTKKYNHLNLFLFQGFRLVPFLVELRAVMDWVWTDTTLSLSNWMCVEDIYANIFIIKCSRETEKKYPQPKGQKKKKIVKYGMGGLIVFFLICIIWFPLLFISLVRSVVGVVNHPVDVTVTVKLGGYEPLFTMSVQQQSIQPYTQEQYVSLTKWFGDNAVAMQFITLYSYEDIVTANIEGSSGSVWRISPPSRQELIKELLGSADMTLRLAWNFQRDLSKGGTVENTFDKHSINLERGNPVRADLALLLEGNRTDLVPHMFPNFIRAPNGAEAKPVSQLYEGNEEGYQNVTLSLKRDGSLEWWDISIAGCNTSSVACKVLRMDIFNDKVSPPSLGFLAGYGIMGLYVSVVLVIGKFVRGFFSEISHSIMFEELPCVDRILKLCTDIFLVRETGELELEEELYSKLIFLYRSPETMIKWTREKNKD
uniref:Piezo-type mechanosensitive ion channel component n=1 Tax=Pygocentrus nattereri TaxID=42514 RepID=A0AAR2M1I4_PYGNA